MKRRVVSVAVSVVCRHDPRGRGRDRSSYTCRPRAGCRTACVPATAAGESGDARRAMRRMVAAAAGRSEVTGMVLLMDLREAYLAAQRTEVTWVILQQASAAARHQPLHKLAMSGVEESAGTAKWLRTRLKETVPQVLATG